MCSAVGNKWSSTVAANTWDKTAASVCYCSSWISLSNWTFEVLKVFVPYIPAARNAFARSQFVSFSVTFGRLTTTVTCCCWFKTTSQSSVFCSARDVEKLSEPFRMLPAAFIIIITTLESLVQFIFSRRIIINKFHNNIKTTVTTHLTLSNSWFPHSILNIYQVINKYYYFKKTWMTQTNK